MLPPQETRADKFAASDMLFHHLFEVPSYPCSEGRAEDTLGSVNNLTGQPFQGRLLEHRFTLMRLYLPVSRDSCGSDDHLGVDKKVSVQIPAWYG